MFAIIHGSHRHSYHWKIVELLKANLEKEKIDVKVVDLTTLYFDFCCGQQTCQEDECIYRGDELSKIFETIILQAEGIYIVTPTYFNMPPAKLKNFIDRSNALLPKLADKSIHPIFGTWISGEADDESIECNSKLLSDYAMIMGWRQIEEINEKVFLGVDNEVNCIRVQEIAEVICRRLK